VAVCCECGDEPSGSCATELVTSEFLTRIRSTLSTYTSTRNKDAVMILRPLFEVMAL
jgi:hypothetical protein